MCGISGCINVSDRIDVNKLKKMTDIIRHRGPDDEGFYLYSDEKEDFAVGQDSIKEIKDLKLADIEKLQGNEYFLGFGHRRLSILDLTSKGHQPMKFSDYVITYNGEVYNYLELRNELEGLGYAFETDSDTEVILKAYKHWGEDCVNHFNGMWSFAIWDKHNQKLFCSRDRFGVKPFYYYYNGGIFIFASEIKQLLEYGIKANVNEKMLFAFLHYGLVDFCEETFFKDIYVLKGGESISIKIDINSKSSSFNKYRYWELDYGIEDSLESFNDKSDIIGEALENSVKLRLRSDVEVGSCLSGGLDSSSVVTLACGELKKVGFNVKEFKTFTASYDNYKEADERYYSDLVVKNSDCSSIKVKPEIKKIESELESIIWHQEEPFRSLSIFAGWCVMKSAKEHEIKVLLDGQGGDETLLGYERFYAFALMEKLKKLKISDFCKEIRLTSENSKLSIKYVIAFFVYFNNITIRKLRLNLKNKNFFNNCFFNRFLNQNIVDDLLIYKTLESLHSIELFSSISSLLRYEDRNSMAHSIETRLPFLDYQFVKKVVKLPIEYKLRNGWTKACLREYMKDKMPQEVTYRKDKLGFSVPQEKWINELNDYFKERLLRNPRSRRYFNMKKIKEIFENKTNSDMRFKFIVVELWMRIFDIK